MNMIIKSEVYKLNQTIEVCKYSWNYRLYVIKEFYALFYFYKLIH